MAARSTNRFKQKPAVPFGDFMLPILGVIALGIVVVGIRILWGPGEPKPTVIAQPRPNQSQTNSKGGASASQPASSRPASKGEKVDDLVIAQPILKNGKTSPSSGAEITAPAANTPSRQNLQPGQQHVTKLEPKKDSTSGARQAAVRAGSIDKSKFVVQCGSFIDRDSANTTVASLRKIGYTSVVRKAEVHGKTYYRVIVAGGADRSLAGEIASRIGAAGFDVLVRPND
ncbi:MAG: SPOR domain-containing protein [Pyramidobacter sp.]|jgi:DedD protein